MLCERTARWPASARATIRTELAALQADVAGAGAEIARQHAQQRGFAGAVGAHQGDDLARLERQRNVVEQRLGADPHGDRGCGERGGHGRRRSGPEQRALAQQQIEEDRRADRRRHDADREFGRRRKRARKGVGDRPAGRRRAARPSAAAGRWLGPIRSRSRCGTMRPTKPITPETETAAPAAAATSATHTRLRRSTSTPAWKASRLAEHEQIEPARDERQRPEPLRGETVRPRRPWPRSRR